MTRAASRVISVLCILSFLSMSSFAQNETGSIEDPTKLSLEVVGVEVVDVLKLISKKAGLNIVAGKDIKGQVTIFLKDVPVRDGIKTILQSQGLAYYEEDNIIKIITEREYQDKFGQPFGDIRKTRTFVLKYQDADSMSVTLNLMKSPQGKIIVNA